MDGTIYIDNELFDGTLDFLAHVKKIGGATGFSPEEAVLVGDRLYTDIACGVNAGISTIFVLSGEGTMEDVESSEKKPEFIYENIRKIYEDIR